MRESQITTNIAHLSAGRFKTVEFPIPPIDEQERIVAGVEAQLSGLARIETATTTQQALANALRSSILSAAFVGLLVAQNPTDESASVLVDRIAAERASSNGKTSPRSRRTRALREEFIL
jgi:type I restriction enzyme S subunit